MLIPSSGSLPLSSPSAAVAAACHSRARRAPLASLTRPGEPQGRLHHLRRATRRLPPCIAGYLAFFLLGRRRSRPPARRLQSLPRAADLLFDFAVSPSVVPLYFPCRFLPLASFTVAAESLLRRPHNRLGHSCCRPRLSACLCSVWSQDPRTSIRSSSRPS